MVTYINDQFVNEEAASLHVSDLSMQRGYGVFDFFRTLNAVPLFMDEHLDRFFTSANALHLSVGKSANELKEIIHHLIKTSSLKEAGIRLMLTGGYSTDSYHPGTPNLVITCKPVKTAGPSDFEKGYRIITHEHQRELPHIKSINYQMAVWLLPLLKEKGVDDVLYHSNGIITEFPRSNIFIITSDQKMVTPARNILLGITRKTIIDIQKKVNPVLERDILLEELNTASEIFLTSTTKKLLPIVEVDGRQIGNGLPGPVTRSVLERLTRAQQASENMVKANDKLP